MPLLRLQRAAREVTTRPVPLQLRGVSPSTLLPGPTLASVLPLCVSSPSPRIASWTPSSGTASACGWRTASSFLTRCMHSACYFASSSHGFMCGVCRRTTLRMCVAMPQGAWLLLVVVALSQCPSSPPLPLPARTCHSSSLRTPSLTSPPWPTRAPRYAQSPDVSLSAMR